MVNTAPPPPRRVLIVDDHPIMCDGLALVLESSGEMEVVGRAADGIEALRLFDELQPDITLMDLRIPKLNGVEAIAAIRRRSPTARILVLTTYSGDAQILRALRAGADGFLLKNSVRRELLEAINAVCSGRRHLSTGAATELAMHAMDDPLTSRETDTLRYVAEGAGNRDIANLMGVAEATVKTHLKNIFSKLRVNDRTQAVVLAAKRGIIDL